MPKRVDYAQRRDQIAEALWRVATDEGLGAATLRRIAAEAEMSMNLVQYYFPTKREMIHYGLARLLERAGARIGEALRTPGSPHQVLRACLRNLLPCTPESHQFTAVYTAYLSHALADEEIRGLMRDVPHELAALLIPLADGTPEPERAINTLLATAAGLAPSILLGTLTTEEAADLLDRQLATLLGT